MLSLFNSANLLSSEKAWKMFDLSSLNNNLKSVLIALLMLYKVATLIILLKQTDCFSSTYS